MGNRNQIQIQREFLEDQQKQASDEIVLKGEVQKDVDNNKARNGMFQEQQKIDSEIINQQQI